MGEVFVSEDLENGRVALVQNFKTNSDSYLGSRVNEDDVIIFLEISGSVVLTTVEDVFEGKLDEVVVSSRADPVVCSHCGSEGCGKALSVTVFGSSLLDTIEQTGQDKRVVGMMGGEEKYHCKDCFEMFRDELEYHVQHGRISSELTIRNL